MSSAVPTSRGMSGGFLERVHSRHSRPSHRCRPLSPPLPLKLPRLLPAWPPVLPGVTCATGSSNSSNTSPDSFKNGSFKPADGLPATPSSIVLPDDDQLPASTSAQGEFCIIEGPTTVQDFARLQPAEIKDNITSRRNRIFLLLEEIRRLRIQQRIKRAEEQLSLSAAAAAVAATDGSEPEVPEYPSSIPFLPPLTSDNLRDYYLTFAALVGAIILFGGLLAPTLELRLGLGGTSYADFITSLHLPSQLSQVDPIVASFSGGAVGVLSALLVVEVNNVKQQEHKRCCYCNGSGYLTCARCSGTGSTAVDGAGSDSDRVGDGDAQNSDPSAAPAFLSLNTASASGSASESGRRRGLKPSSQRCPNCSGSTKVMCPTCLCTGMALVTEHDPRIDPFD